MYILGISCFYHDSAAAIIKDGELIAAAEEERFSRKKHDSGFPENAINFCLRTAGITPGELDYVVFYEKPFIKFHRIVTSILQTFPKSYKVFKEAMTVGLLDKLWIKNIIEKKLNISSDKILFSDHHEAHAASSFFCSPFEESVILTIDGVGEWTTATFGFGKSNNIKIDYRIKFPHSLGLLYSAFTAFLGFEVNEGEYKVMGMAPYGQPRYIDKIYKIVKVNDDGSFYLDMDYFSFHYSTEKTFSQKFVELFGEPRKPKDSEYLDTYYADIAASIQFVTEEIILKMVKNLIKKYNLRKLCIAGGVALNSKANGRILQETDIEEIFIQPSAGDGGGAIGACLWAYHQLLGYPRKFVMSHAYWGESYNEEQIKTFLDNNNIKYTYFFEEDKLCEFIVDNLINNKVIGFYQGKFEFGPRALGNRSILADPRNPEMKDIVNKKIKFREPFRPFAPSVIHKFTDEYFELKSSSRQYPAKFMLLVAPVKNGKKNTIPAVTHVDGTGRLQMVYEDTNPRYYNLINTFYQATGIPVVLNTSFNLKGEPIVNSPKDAYSTFIRSGLDILCLDKFVINKE